MKELERKYLSALYDVAQEFKDIEIISKDLGKEIRGVYVNNIPNHEFCYLSFRNGKIFIGARPGHKHVSSRYIEITPRTVTYKEAYARGYYGSALQVIYEEKNTERLQKIFGIVKENREAILAYLETNRAMYINTEAFEEGFTKELLYKDFEDGDVREPIRWR